MSFHEQPDEKTNVHEVHNNDNDKMQIGLQNLAKSKKGLSGAEPNIWPKL